MSSQVLFLVLLFWPHHIFLPFALGFLFKSHMCGLNSHIVLVHVGKQVLKSFFCGHEVHEVNLPYFWWVASPSDPEFYCGLQSSLPSGPVTFPAWLRCLRSVKCCPYWAYWSHPRSDFGVATLWSTCGRTLNSCQQKRNSGA